MADAVIFFGFGTPLQGREAKALAVFGETLAYFASLQQQGTIESFEPVLLGPHGGDLGGFVLVRGEAAKLAALRPTDHFQRMVTRALLIVSNVGVIDGQIGEGLTRAMSDYQQHIAELT